MIDNPQQTQDMETQQAAASKYAVVPFRFESYGVRVHVTSNEQDIVDEAATVLRKSLLGDVRTIEGGQFDHHFELNRSKDGMMHLVQNEVELSRGRSRKKFFKFFDSVIRVAVGEYAVDRVFLHAGVVGWKGKAIIIPADSFKGKSTLVAELVKNGAEYYSDEFAIVDEDGLVHPFARPLAMRTDDGKFRAYEVSVEELGGKTGSTPLPVGLVLITEYAPSKRWNPKLLTPGQGVLEMIPYTLCLRYAPDKSMSVLNKIARNAIIASSPRGSAETFALILLEFVDKTVY